MEDTEIVPDKIDAIQFHQFHRTGGNRKRGVIHVIILPQTNRISIGWSMCNRSRGDVFDAKVGRDIAQKRAVKALVKKSPGVEEFKWNLVNDNAQSAEWTVHGMSEYPKSMQDAMSRVVSRFHRIITSIEFHRNV